MIWHLFHGADDRFEAVCGVPAFGDNTVNPRVLGACLPHCFSEDWSRITCQDCLRIMERGIPK